MSSGKKQGGPDIPDENQLNVISLDSAGEALVLENDNGEVFSLEIDDHLVELVSKSNGGNVVNNPSGNQASGNLISSIESTAKHTLQLVRLESELTVKEVQARLRAGESPSSIARDGSWNLEKIEKFSGPIMQERAYIIAQAHKLDIRKEPDSAGNRNLLSVVEFLLGEHGVESNEIEWDTYRKENGEWIISAKYETKSGERIGQWSFNLNKGSIQSIDDEARWLSGEKEKPKPPRPLYGYLNTPPVEQPRTTFDYPTKPPRLTAVKPERAKENTIELDFNGSDGINSFSDEDWKEENYSEGSQIDEELETQLSVVDESDENQDIEGFDEVHEEKSERTSKVKLPSWDEMIFGKKDE